MSIPPTLLLADDSVAIQRIVSLTFADQPVRLVLAKDGQDAINRMATDRPDLVLADTNMPCVDGYEVARWVRQQPHLDAVPVLLLAGITDPVDEQRLHDSGANGVLEKPFEPSHVISRVKELLGIKGASPAASTRLVTQLDAKPIKRVLPKPPSGTGITPANVAAPPDSEAEPVPGFETSGVSFTHQDDQAGFSTPPEYDDETASTHAAADEASVAAAEHWFVDKPVAVDERQELSFYGYPETAPRGMNVDFGQEAASDEATWHGGKSAVITSRHAAAQPTASPASQVNDFASLLAAEQSGPPSGDGRSGNPGILSPEAIEMLATSVVEKLRPHAMRDELQRALGSGLSEAVHHSVATETRAAVAEAVQAAVDGSILGTVRGAVNEAISAALPAAVSRSLEGEAAGRLHAAVRDSVSGTVPAAVEQAFEAFVSSRLTVLVRDTLEREVRETVAPEVHRLVREVMATTLQQAVAEAVATSMSAAVFEAVRQEAAGHVQQVVVDTSERLVREEIARIREKRT